VLEVRYRVHGGMGCAGSKAVDTRDVQLQEEKTSGVVEPPLEFKMPDFEYSTPMLVMPFLQFKAQGRIMKSVQKWRDEALAQGWLVEFKEGEGKVAIFISHTWWDRDFKDETNDASDVYDKGSPDWQSGEKKNLKWRIICAGVERLVEEKGLEAKNVMIWCDWQSSAPHIGAPTPDQRISASPAADAFAACPPPRSLPGRQGAEAQGREEPDPVRDHVRVHARADRGGGRPGELCAGW